MTSITEKWSAYSGARPVGPHEKSREMGCKKKKKNQRKERRSLERGSLTLLTQLSRSGLTMLLSRHTVGTYPETAHTQLVRELSATVVSAR